MERENEIVEKLKDFLKESLVGTTVPRERRIFVYIKKDALKDAVEYLVKDLKFTHLSTITGVDLGGGIEVLYHLAYEGAIELSLGLTVPKNNPSVPTVTDLIPGAVLYEREVHDLLGVNFEGHPDLSPLVLPEGWPQNVYPLRKEHSLEQLREMTSKSRREKSD
ncbi:NADH-quinone oxidoreductase subunit C [Candidatus Bathyarchaeota archaeon]|nr:NADH-quinone oxidoreductase subunit C [Candidatus Bathyarchaeota archaeon]